MLNKKVLIVDDCKIVRTLFSRILTDIGLNTILASNGLEALEKVKLYHPDLVILAFEKQRYQGQDLFLLY